MTEILLKSVCVAECLVFSTSDNGVLGSNPAGGEILSVPEWRFIPQSPSCLPFYCPDTTEILLKRR